MKKAQVRYLLIKEETCPTCKGGVWKEHPLWTQYFEEYWKPFMEEHGRPPTDEEEKEWWSNMGFDPKEIPPQEVECWECEGRGVIRKEVTEVPLEEALRILSVVGTPEGGVA